MRIAIVIAMEAEANPVIKRFALKEFDNKPPIKIYKNDENEIFLGVNGKCNIYGVDNVGTQAASLNTYILLNEIKPDIVINAGTAGGFISMGGEIGDVYIGSGQIVYHDRRIQLPNFEDFGHGYYKTIQTDLLAKKFALKKGVITTGNSLDQTETDTRIMKMHNASCKDMEAAAVAWLCQMFNVPLIALKSITDLVDGTEKVEIDFAKNFNFAIKNLEDKLYKIIYFIQSIELSKLKEILHMPEQTKYSPNNY
jgi:5'-methylthioadenosine nucleosidase